MIITDLMEYVGLKVRVYFEDNMKSEKSGKILEGYMEYVPSYCELYNYRRPKHFYISTKDGDWAFRAWHVKKVEVIDNGKST